ncbi:MAG: hypothetical protein ACYS0G_07965 [Planctomycetota bacterium]
MRMRPNRLKEWKVTAAAAAVICAVSAADGARRQGPATEPPPPSRDEPVPADDEQPLPSLDDLLGLEGADRDQSTVDAADRDFREELDRELDETRITDAFALALEKMAISADLLDVKLDSGLGTQRLQEEILSKLDQVIDQARRQQSMQRGSAGQGRPSQSRARSQPQPGPAPPRRTGQRNSQPQDSQAGDPPARQEGDINTMLEETGSEWGNLPQRIRDMLLQGRSEKFSSLYRRLTEEYYTRLAEDGPS